MSRVAVTGASGFIGRYLCAALEAEGHGVIRIGRGGDADRKTDYSRDSLTSALEGANHVVHLAGRRMTREDDPYDLAPFYEPNVAVLASLVAAAREVGVARIALASTIGVYGPGSGTPYRETTRPSPTNAYAASKVMAEAHLEMLTRPEGPHAVYLRYAAVYGAGEKGTPALMTLVNRARQGLPLILNGNPDHRIDEIYVRDAVAGTIAAIFSDATGPVNLGGGSAQRLEDIARTASEVFGPVDVRVEGKTAPAPDTRLVLDHAAEALGWAPAYSLRSGMEDFRATLAAEAG